MMKFQAFDRARVVVCEIYCLHGKVVRIYSWKYAKRDLIFDEYRSELGREEINPGHFEQAISAFCRDFKFDKFEDLLEAIREDQEYLNIARSVMTRHAISMRTQANKINVALKTKK